MCDLDLCLSDGVLWGLSRNYSLINYFQLNKVILKLFSYLLSLWNCHYFITSAIDLFEYSLSHQHLYFRWPT
jgi:hypothetical protein